ncbi:hypothetical protein ACQ4PT_010828 [Festuca glaucescens]
MRTDSGSFKTSIGIHDDFFLQEGFTYTGLLLGDITHPAVYQQPYDQDNIKDSSATMLREEEENPWDVSMFNDVQLDEVYDAGTIDNQQQTNSKGTNDEPSTSKSNDNQHNPDINQVITEQDIDIFISNEALAAEGVEKNEDTTNDSASQLIPEVGMEFDTREEVQKFFNLYAYIVGFSISCVSSYRTTSKKRNNEVIRFTMKCNKYRVNTQAETENIVAQRQSTVIAKTNCKVKMVASEKQGLWIITSLTLLHNHELCPQSRFYRSHIYMSDGEKEMIRTMKHCNMPQGAW